jgi:hypothetical protein
MRQWYFLPFEFPEFKEEVKETIQKEVKKKGGRPRKNQELSEKKAESTAFKDDTETSTDEEDMVESGVAEHSA